MFPSSETLNVTLERRDGEKERRTERVCWTLAAGCLVVLVVTLLRKLLWVVCCSNTRSKKKITENEG